MEIRRFLGYRGQAYRSISLPNKDGNSTILGDGGQACADQRVCQKEDPTVLGYGSPFREKNGQKTVYLNAWYLNRVCLH